MIRVGDSSYAFWYQGQKVKIHIKNKKLSPETRYNLAEKVYKIFESRSASLKLNRFRKFYFRYGQKKWKVRKGAPTLSCILKIFVWLAKVLGLIHPKSKGSTRDIYIENIASGPAAKKRTIDEWQQKNQTRRVWASGALPPFTPANFKRNRRYEASFEVSPREYKQGVRVKLPLKAFDPSEKAYNDPFSTLSGLAFQCFEPSFVAHDEDTPEKCSFCLAVIDEALCLVEKTSALATVTAKQAAARVFLSFLLEEHGNEKVEEIAHRFNIDLGILQELTSEHIYRFNLGTSFFEVRGIESWLQKTEDWIEDERSLQEEAPLLPTLKEYFFGSQARAIYQTLSSLYDGEEIKVKHFLNWLKGRGLPGSELSRLSPEVFVELVEITGHRLEDQDRALTFRKIDGPIQSGYTSAQKGKYKPWVDLQEIKQLFPQLINAKSWGSYQELLSHVISKKHLPFSNPSKVFRMGSLIPAPPAKPGGVPRWYVVSSCVTNRYTLSYTFESVCNDPTLPAIKLYRSTSIDDYAVYSKQTIVNDFSHLNSPGYVGRKFTEPYELPFFKERTIPTWVGYQNVARMELGKASPYLINVYKYLRKSSAHLNAELEKDRKIKRFPELLKEHDLILHELYLAGQGMWDWKSSSSTFNRLFPLFYDYLVKTYINVTRTEPTQDRWKKDAQTLINFTKSLVSKDFKGKIHPAEKDRVRAYAKTLIKELQIHVLGKTKIQGSLDPVLKEALNRLEQGAYVKLLAGDNDAAKAILGEWSLLIDEHAVKKGENIARKKAQSLNFSGHSLGGACAQIGLVHFLVRQGRIPLPGHQATCYLFDEPAINGEDNAIFKAFGNENEELLKALNVDFSLFRRQAAGDFVPLSGEEHLGAALSPEEEKKIGKWLRFDAAVNKRLKTSHSVEIADSMTAHDTRFLGSDYRKGWRLERAKLVDASNLDADYESTHYTPFIQGLFDKRGRVTTVPSERALRIYKIVFNKLWKLHDIYDLIMKEEYRKSTHWFFNKLRFLVMKNKYRKIGHTLPSDMEDRYGNFAIHYHQGIVSKQLRP